MSSITADSCRPRGSIGLGQNAYTQSGPERLSPTPIAPNLITTKGQIRENKVRIISTEERARIWESEGANAGEDEEMLNLASDDLGKENSIVSEPMASDVELDPFIVLTGTLAAGGKDMQLAAFMLAMRLEGSAREKALGLLNTLVGSQATSGGETEAAYIGKAAPILEEGPELEDSDAGHRTRTLDYRLMALLRQGFHLPLTLCTNAAIEAVQMKPSLLVCMDLADANGTEVSMVDPYSGWPDESSLTSEEWKDAWSNLLHVLPSIIEPAGVSRFQKHFDLLRNQENFLWRFPAILKFDIKIRYTYFQAKKCTPFTPGSSAYIHQFYQIQLDMISDLAPTSRRHSYNPQRPMAPARGRYLPYDAAKRVDRFGVCLDRRDSAPAHASTAPFCFICAESGHRANACTRSRLPDGKPCFAIFAGGKLIAQANRTEICLSWNASGRSPCRNIRCTRTPTAHTCSFCGSSTHHAGSKRCVD
ncbi:hypothetical protein C8Q79DRAFT_926285 [Trametes meyenii]|nr:hypothetical protein C8Q79DRAFT_926285 [Trametes meyenii]